MKHKNVRKFPGLFLKLLLKMVRWIILFYAVMALIMSIGLTFPFIGVISLITIIIFLPYRRKILAFASEIAYKVLSLALPAAALMMIFLSLFTPLLPNPGTEWNNRLAAIKSRVVGVNNSHLNFREKIGLYTLGIVMSVSAYPFYPEVAKEQFLLQFSGPSERIWHSNFAMASDRISRPVFDFMRSLPVDAIDGTVKYMQERDINFTYGRKDQRVALALQPCKVSGKAVRVNGHWWGSFQAQIPIRYFPECRAPLFTLVGTTVWFEEGLFFEMQRAGWFFPYLATWKWEVCQNDVPVI